MSGSRARRALDRLYAASGVLAAASLGAICLVMLVQAFGREVGLLVRGADDITGWLTAAASFLALGHTFRHGELVRVGLALERLPPRARWWSELSALAVTAIFAGYMTWAVASFVYDSWRFGEVAQGLIRIPIWIPQLTFLAGTLVFQIAVLDDLFAVLRREKPAYQLAEEERRRRGDFSESV